MNRPQNEQQHSRYPVDYLGQAQRGIRKSRPDWIQPDSNRGFADDSESPPGQPDRTYIAPVPYFD